jgi:hypothetical protein
LVILLPNLEPSPRILRPATTMVRNTRDSICDPSSDGYRFKNHEDEQAAVAPLCAALLPNK